MKQKTIIDRRENIFKEFISNKPIDNFKEQLACKYHISLDTLRRDLLYYFNNCATKEEQKKFKTLTKYYSLNKPISVIEQGYYYGMKVNWEFNLMNEYAKKNNYNIYSLERIIISYAYDFLNADIEEIKLIIKQRCNYYTSFEFKNLYANIQKCKSDDEVIDLCIKFNSDLYRLKRLISSYCVNVARKNNLNINTIYDKVNNDFKPYFTYLASQKKLKVEEKKRKEEKELFEKTTQIIMAFIVQDKDKDTFCEINKISPSKWNKYVRIIKEINPSLYKNYCHRIKKNQETQQQIAQEKALQLLYFLKNGIEFKNTKRQIDIIDYDRIINYPIDKVMEGARNAYYEELISKDELITIGEFIKKNNLYTGIDSNIVALYNEIEFDKALQEQNKFIINKDGRQEIRVITEEEKRNIFDEIQKYNVPVTRKRYYTCIQRLIKGIDNYDTKKLVKKNTKLFY